ncbi:MAG TPA: outer membrane lipoprotein chaperone LolA [Vicinamibacterales bacterium]|nr:outer membrane lipoprotein chaperone LolA [Vicinamibacterales bacterium]
MRVNTLVAVVLLLTSSVVSQAQSPTADAVARDVQQKYDRIKDFSADFVHSYRGGILKQQATERGRLFVKKPGKMRWEYTAPERKLFVSDGRKIYSYIPQDKQVVVSTMPQGDQAPTPALFLTGNGNIARDFNVAFDNVADAPAGSLSLKLTPRKREPEYESLTLVVDSKTLNLRMLITVDTQGGRSSFAFTNLKENVGLADSPFVFQMPRNVEVVMAGGR